MHSAYKLKPTKEANREEREENPSSEEEEYEILPTRKPGPKVKPGVRPVRVPDELMSEEEEPANLPKKPSSRSVKKRTTKGKGIKRKRKGPAKDAPAISM